MTDNDKASSMFSLFPSPLIHIPSREALNTLLLHNPHLEFTAVSSAFSGCSLGIPWWLALLEHSAHIPSILDCGASVSLSIHAFHEGIEGVVCRQFPSTAAPQWQNRLFYTRPPVFEVEDIIS